MAQSDPNQAQNTPPAVVPETPFSEAEEVYVEDDPIERKPGIDDGLQRLIVFHLGRRRHETRVRRGLRSLPEGSRLPFPGGNAPKRLPVSGQTIGGTSRQNEETGSVQIPDS